MSLLLTRHILPCGAKIGDDLIIVLLGERRIAAGKDGEGDAVIGAVCASVLQTVAHVERVAPFALFEVGRIGLQGVLNVDDEGAAIAVLVKYGGEDALSVALAAQFLAHGEVPAPVVSGQPQHHCQTHQHLTLVVGGIVDVHDVKQMNQVIVGNLLAFGKRRLV